MNLERKEIQPGIALLEIVGTVSMGPDCDRLEQEIEELLGKNVRKFILDLARLQKVDSAGVGKIVACFSRVKKAGGKLSIAGAEGSVRDVLRMTQVDRIVGIYPTAQAAAENLATPQ